MKKFDSPFEPVVKPQFGPLFPRIAWKKDFSPILTKCTYCITVLVILASPLRLRMLSLVTGVVYFRVLEQTDIWKRFANAISFLDTQLQTVCEYSFLNWLTV